MATARIIELAMLLLAAACSAPAVQGTVEGADYDLPDALLVNADDASSSTLLISNNAGLCAEGQSGSYLQNTDFAEVALAQVDSAGTLSAPAVPGVYQIGNANPAPGDLLAAAEVAAVANCEFGRGCAATSGMVELDAISTGSGGPHHLSGFMDLGFESGESMSGPFDAELCGGHFALTIQFCPR